MVTGRCEMAFVTVDCQSTALPISMLPARKIEVDLISGQAGGLHAIALPIFSSHLYERLFVRLEAMGKE